MNRKKDRRTPPAKVYGALGVGTDRMYPQQATAKVPVNATIPQLAYVVDALRHLGEDIADEAMRADSARYARVAADLWLSGRYALVALDGLIKAKHSYDREVLS